MGKKKREVKTINLTDLLINSSGKIGRHEPQVKSGCGAHKSAKDYKRKEKHHKKYDE